MATIREAIDPRHPLDDRQHLDQRNQRAADALFCLYNADPRQWSVVELLWIENVNPSNAARRLSVSRRTVYDWIALAKETAKRVSDRLGANQVYPLLHEIIEGRVAKARPKKRPTAPQQSRHPRYRKDRDQLTLWPM